MKHFPYPTKRGGICNNCEAKITQGSDTYAVGVHVYCSEKCATKDTDQHMDGYFGGQRKRKIMFKRIRCWFKKDHDYQGITLVGFLCTAPAKRCTKCNKVIEIGKWI